jgi:hypothetical protein
LEPSSFNRTTIKHLSWRWSRGREILFLFAKVIFCNVYKRIRLHVLLHISQRPPFADTDSDSFSFSTLLGKVWEDLPGMSRGQRWQILRRRDSLRSSWYLEQDLIFALCIVTSRTVGSRDQSTASEWPRWVLIWLPARFLSLRPVRHGPADSLIGGDGCILT